MRKTDRQIAQVNRYIASHGNHRLTSKEIASEIGIDCSDFVRVFQRATGVTPKKYLDQRMKSHVLQCFAYDNMQGYKICYELGFSSEQAFYRWVKRVFGISFKRLKLQYQGVKKTPPSKNVRQSMNRRVKNVVENSRLIYFMRRSFFTALYSPAVISQK